MARKSVTKTAVATLAGEFITGLGKRFPNGATVLTLGGGAANTTVDSAIASCKAIVDNRAAVKATRAAAKAKVAEENAKLPALLVFFRELEACIRFTFGADATALADFGLEPAKARTPMSAEEKAVATAKREATRKARGIVPKAEKQAVKGNVTATLVVTPAPPAEPPATPPKA